MRCCTVITDRGVAFDVYGLGAEEIREGHVLGVLRRRGLDGPTAYRVERRAPVELGLPDWKRTTRLEER